MLIDLKKLWEVTVVVSTEAHELSEKDIYNMCRKTHSSL